MPLATDVIGRLKRVAAASADRIYGIESESQVQGPDLGYEDGSGYLHYQASSWLSVPGVFAGWTPPPGRGDVIIDLGCGKGRALVQMARRFPVDRILGVELSPDLAQIARDNLARTARHHRAARSEILVADVRTFAIPDDVTIVYIANPFDGPVFADALARIVDSYDRRPRRLQVAYVHPTEALLVDASPRFAELSRPTARWMRPLAVDPTEFRRYEVLGP